MDTLDTETEDARIAALVLRVQDAQRAVQIAHERAEYHGWKGARRGNALTDAKRELREARRALRQQTDSPAERADEGRGAFALAILAALTVGAVVAALVLIHVAHGGF